MEYEVLGFPPNGPSLTLDWQAFGYAGKFEMTNTGKAVLQSDEAIVAAAAFNADRDDSDRAWIRYVTVRSDRQGEGLGTRLAVEVTKTLQARGYDRVSIAVNNPIAYRALYKAGYHFTGRETGIAELVLETPGEQKLGPYTAGLERFDERDLPDREQELVKTWLEAEELPPTVNDIPFALSNERANDGTR